MVLEVPHKEVHQAAHGRLAHRLDPGEEEFENSLMTHNAGLFYYKEHGLKNIILEWIEGFPNFCLTHVVLDSL